MDQKQSRSSPNRFTFGDARAGREGDVGHRVGNDQTGDAEPRGRYADTHAGGPPSELFGMADRGLRKKSDADHQGMGLADILAAMRKNMPAAKATPPEVDKGANQGSREGARETAMVDATSLTGAESRN